MARCIGNDGTWEYWQSGGEIYRVKLDNRGPIMDTSMPGNVRWECPAAMWTQYCAMFLLTITTGETK